MNDARLRGLALAGSQAAGPKRPHNHAQTVGNLRRSLQNAAAGARLIQAEGLDSNRSPTSPAPTVQSASVTMSRKPIPFGGMGKLVNQAHRHAGCPLTPQRGRRRASRDVRFDRLRSRVR
jgi:hypothetical protein